MIIQKMIIFAVILLDVIALFGIAKQSIRESQIEQANGITFIVMLMNIIAFLF